MITETSRERFSISIFGRKHVCRLAYCINNFENGELRRFQRCNLCHTTEALQRIQLFLCRVIPSPNAQAICLYSYLYYFAKAIVEAKKRFPKNKITTKSTQTWLNIWGKWANERKFNPKLEEYEHEDLHKKLQMIYAEVRTKDGFFYNFVENIIYKKSYDRLCIYGHSVVMFLKFSNCTHLAHISRNALVFIRFLIHIVCRN